MWSEKMRKWGMERQPEQRHQRSAESGVGVGVALGAAAVAVVVGIWTDTGDSGFAVVLGAAARGAAGTAVVVAVVVGTDTGFGDSGGTAAAVAGTGS